MRNGDDTGRLNLDRHRPLPPSLATHRPDRHFLSHHRRRGPAGEQTPHVREDGVAYLHDRCSVSNAHFLGTADDDAILAWEKVAEMAGEEILQAGLRREQHELALDRVHRPVLAYCQRTKSGAIDNNILFKSRDFAQVREFARYE